MESQVHITINNISEQQVSNYSLVNESTDLHSSWMGHLFIYCFINNKAQSDHAVAVTLPEVGLYCYCINNPNKPETSDWFNMKTLVQGHVHESDRYLPHTPLKPHVSESNGFSW